MASIGRAVEGWEVGDEPSVPPEASTVPTAPESTDRRAIGRSLLARWVFIGILAVFLLCGLAGVFGVRTTTSSASGGGYDLRVTHAAVTRPGLATPFEIEISRRDGLPLTGPIRSPCPRRTWRCSTRTACRRLTRRRRAPRTR